MARTLGQHWRRAVLLSVGRVAFDYLALLAAVAAVGAHPRPSLIVVAYVSAVVLALIPITPGGLGFVEAGLTGVLTLAGHPGERGRARDAALPAGGVLAPDDRRAVRLRAVPRLPPPTRQAYDVEPA